MDVTVTATKSFEYRGTRVRRGMTVEMRPVEAAAAARRGEVTLTRGAVVTPDPEDVAPRRRRYRRRDLVADE